jgi:hypothetical protein
MSVVPADPMYPPNPGEAPRIRFVAVRIAARALNGRSRAEVDLRRVDGLVVSGQGEAEPSVYGDQRAAAIATTEALGKADGAGHRFELLGVKNVRAFDQTIVLVQLGVGTGRGYLRLVGSAVGDDDLVAATVRAVLNASNRILWMPASRLVAEQAAHEGVREDVGAAS